MVFTTHAVRMEVGRGTKDIRLKGSLGVKNGVMTEITFRGISWAIFRR
jgi:hypothetical protein